jgi:hypothetical protein
MRREEYDVVYLTRGSSVLEGTMRSSILVTVLAGVAGVAAFLVLNFVGFKVADPILGDPELQSAKLTAVWDEIEPLPPAHGEAASITILVLIGIGRAFVYRWLGKFWPSGLVSRVWRYWLLVWFLTFVYTEFAAPFTLFGEPAALVLVELVILGVAVLGEAFAVVGIMHVRKAPTAAS